MTDTIQVANVLNRTIQVHAVLGEAVTERRDADVKVALAPAPSAPLNVIVLDQRDLLADQVVGWARITEEESGIDCPGFAVPVAGQWMVQRAVWIAGASWAPDLVDELAGTTRKAEGMLGTLPRRRRLPDDCHCGQPRWVYLTEGQGAMQVECAGGHASTLHQSGHQALVSIRGAQRILGIRRATISEALRNGGVVNYGSEDRPLVDTQEVGAYLRSMLGNHMV